MASEELDQIGLHHFDALKLEFDAFRLVKELIAERDALAGRVEQLEDRLRPLRENCLRTFMGGYSDGGEVEIFRHGMETVCNVVDDALTPPQPKEPSE